MAQVIRWFCPFTRSKLSRPRTRKRPKVNFVLANSAAGVVHVTLSEPEHNVTAFLELLERRKGESLVTPRRHLLTRWPEVINGERVTVRLFDVDQLGKSDHWRWTIIDRWNRRLLVGDYTPCQFVIQFEDGSEEPYPFTVHRGENSDISLLAD